MLTADRDKLIIMKAKLEELVFRYASTIGHAKIESVKMRINMSFLCLVHFLCTTLLRSLVSTASYP